MAILNNYLIRKEPIEKRIYWPDGYSALSSTASTGISQNTIYLIPFFIKKACRNPSYIFYLSTIPAGITARFMLAMYESAQDKHIIGSRLEYSTALTSSNITTTTRIENECLGLTVTPGWHFLAFGYSYTTASSTNISIRSFAASFTRSSFGFLYSRSDAVLKDPAAESFSTTIATTNYTLQLAAQTDTIIPGTNSVNNTYTNISDLPNTITNYVERSAANPAVFLAY